MKRQAIKKNKRRQLIFNDIYKIFLPSVGELKKQKMEIERSKNRLAYGILLGHECLLFLIPFLFHVPFKPYPI